MQDSVQAAAVPMSPLNGATPPDLAALLKSPIEI
jgi:hypothetical protein